MSLSPTVKKVERFIVTGFSVKTQNKDEFNENTAKIPCLWQKFHTSELAHNASVFGVYSSYDSDANGYYTVTAGVETSNPQLEHVIVQAGDYLVFQNKGLMPATVVETWVQVWKFFETHPEYRRNFISDFEAYTGPDQITIYIGLK